MGYPKEVHRKCRIHRRTWDCVNPETSQEEPEDACPWCEVDRLRRENEALKAWRDSDPYYLAGKRAAEAAIDAEELRRGHPRDRRLMYVVCAGCETPCTSEDEYYCHIEACSLRHIRANGAESPKESAKEDRVDIVLRALEDGNISVSAYRYGADKASLVMQTAVAVLGWLRSFAAQRVEEGDEREPGDSAWQGITTP
jgi:hypothetical protein